MNYGFKCPADDCISRAYLNILMPMEGRPKCPNHRRHYIPETFYPDDAAIDDILVSPDYAADLLTDPFPSALVDVDQDTVNSYAELMRSGKWTSVTKAMGGAHHPILMRDGKLLIGTQRLLACIASNTPLETVIVRF